MHLPLSLPFRNTKTESAFVKVAPFRARSSPNCVRVLVKSPSQGYSIFFKFPFVCAIFSFTSICEMNLFSAAIENTQQAVAKMSLFKAPQKVVLVQLEVVEFRFQVLGKLHFDDLRNVETLHPFFVDFFGDFMRVLCVHFDFVGQKSDVIFFIFLPI